MCLCKLTIDEKKMVDNGFSDYGKTIVWPYIYCY